MPFPPDARPAAGLTSPISPPQHQPTPQPPEVTPLHPRNVSATITPSSGNAIRQRFAWLTIWGCSITVVMLKGKSALMSHKYSSLMQSIAASVVATIIFGTCAAYLPRPQSDGVLIASLIVVVAGIICGCGLFPAWLPPLGIHHRVVRLNLAVVMPTLIVLVTLMAIRHVNPDTQKYLTSDTVCVVTIAAFLGFVIRKALPSLPRMEATALAATCVPIEYDDAECVYRVTLIRNPNYNREQWMFPGGHVHFSDGNYPPDVARARVRAEAGLEVDLLTPVRVGEQAFDGMVQIASPHFNFVFTLDESARCTRAEGHEYHFDFTYVGVVKKRLDLTPTHEILLIEFDEAHLTEDGVRAELASAFTKFYRDKRDPQPAHPYPPSIPTILSKALSVFPRGQSDA